jgi:hypothetical protein
LGDRCVEEGRESMLELLQAPQDIFCNQGLYATHISTEIPEQLAIINTLYL